MGAYDDIINLPHPTSTKYPHMSLIDRAAQFSPFAALVGHEAAIQETARLTDKKIELTEDEKLRLLADADQKAMFTYFLPDERKDGGRYIIVAGVLKKLFPLEHRVILTDGTVIPIEDILEIDSESVTILPFKG